MSANSQLGQNKVKKRTVSQYDLYFYNVLTVCGVKCGQLRSRVVVVKYDRKPLSNKTLFSFTERFGILREHLVLKNKVKTPTLTSATMFKHT